MGPSVLLLDNSVWSRRREPSVRDWLSAAMESAQLSVCLPFLLEAGFSAQSGVEHENIMRRLTLLPQTDITHRVEKLAIEAQGKLAQIGHHRLSPTDLIIAACAHEARAGVLHYDGDYDLIAKHTALEFESRWVAPAGTLA
jgi:predicted nucleic acid-binding protein